MAYQITYPELNLTGAIRNTDLFGAIDCAHGGTGQSSYAVGDLLQGASSTSLSKLGAGAAGSFLRGAGAATLLAWSTLILPNAATANRIPYATATNTWGESNALNFDGTKLIVGNNTPQTSTNVLFQIQADGGFGDLMRFKVSANGGFTIIDHFGATNWDYYAPGGYWVTARDIHAAGFTSSAGIQAPKYIGYNYSGCELHMDQATIGFRFRDTNNKATLIDATSAAATTHLKLGYDASNYIKATVASTGATTIAITGSAPSVTFSDKVIFGSTARAKTYTVAGLPAGTQGDLAVATDLLTPTFLTEAVGGGAVVGLCLYNGTAWVTV